MRPQGTFSPRARNVRRVIAYSEGLGFDACSLLPTQWLPIAKDIVKQFGCTDVGKAAGQTALLKEFPAVGFFLAPTIINCVCGSSKAPPIPVQQPTASSALGNPAIWAGAAVLGVGAYMFYKSQKPKPVGAAPAAPPTPVAPASK